MQENIKCQQESNTNTKDKDEENMQSSRWGYVQWQELTTLFL